MTDKQSTVVVSRELAERITRPQLKPRDETVQRRAISELRALLAATPEQAVDVGEPVAYVTENPHCPEGMSDEISEYLPVGTELYRYAQPPAKSGPWKPLSAPGQIKPGDWLHFTVGGKFICTKAKEILEAGTHREEVVYNRSRNHYFITGMAVDGTSSHKGVMIAKP